MAFDFKTATPDATVPDGSFIMGADSQSAADPSLYTIVALATKLLAVGTSPGSDTQVLFNDAGVLAGDSGLTFNKTTNALTVGGATVTTSAPVIDMTQTWNAGGVTFTGLKLNVTDTAAAAASLLIDLQVGGTSKFNIRKDGYSYFNASSTDYTLIRPAHSIYAYLNNLGISTRLVFDDGGGYGADAALWLGSSGVVKWQSVYRTDSGTTDLYLSRAAAANLQLGAADAAAPVAQTLSVQSVVAGTTNTAGTDFSIYGSKSTGSAAGGSIKFYTSPAGSSGTAQNAGVLRLTIPSTGGINTDAISALSSYAIYVGPITSAAFASGTDGSLGGTGAGLAVAAQQAFGWSDTAYNPASAVDVRLYRDAANTLALRNGTAAQAFRVYGTYTNSSNYSLFQIYSSDGNSYIGTVNAGTGSVSNLFFGTSGNNWFGISASGGSFFPNGTLATNMTTGFINIPGAAGAPSGVPTTTTGFPEYWDSTNKKHYVYSGGVWYSSAAYT